MKNLLICRRTFMAAICVLAMMTIALVQNVDNSMAIASIAIALAGSNAAEGAIKAKFTR